MLRKQKPLHLRPPFIQPKRKSRKRAIGIGAGLASVFAVAIAGVVAKKDDAS